MDGGGVALVERVEFWLDGEFMRMRTFSGKKAHDHAIPMRMFMQHGPNIRALCAEWFARKAEVIPIKPAKGKKRKKH